ncbi:hypothetical protein P6P90_16545 [Ectobacillus antri]|jgi:hypothetical protein|uniref:Uncharacterized protein n=1 Tax=Ectobacillus antri TaxID=2486280 RepID=A0ABT6H857_9BACI|nr:hypothetical protein [Ectobacillus antri]MDG4658523.1 hypothetical protein [Ectobacillus antri]MDG5755506.1 hypothetical protein [Ectobacillus antri]
MIYKKDANFPYPLLTNTSTSYESSNFILDVQLHENVHHYRFDINYEIDSEFIMNLLHTNKAQLVLVVQSKDNKFFKLKPHETYVTIEKSRISVSKRTSLQLHLQSLEDISFANNDDLNDFYRAFKSDIVIPKHTILGFSNVVIFDGSITKPLALFEKKVDPTLASDIKIELGTETIIIHYKDEQLQFSGFPKAQALNNPYVYMGLQKALQRFIVNNDPDAEQVDLNEIDTPTDPLDLKLYNLMKKKMVQELSVDNIDEVIYAISDRIIERYTAAIKGLSSNGN